jgi:hypothetical protein
VLVRDENGSVLAGAAVTFIVTGGGGTVTGGNATTNSAGIATVGGWTLGATAGANTLDATTGTLPAVTFTAHSNGACNTVATHTLGSTTNAELSPSDCRLSDGTFVDFYTVSIPTAGTYVFSQSSTAFDTYLEVLSQDGAQLLGINDDIDLGVNMNSSLKMLLPAGNFIIAANAYDLNAIGAYTLISAASADPITNCEDHASRAPIGGGFVFVTRGISSPQSLQSTDCTSSGNFSDQYVVIVYANQPVTVSMTSAEVDSYLEISQFNQDGSLSVVASNDDIDSSTKNARIVFTPTVSNYYVITAKSPSAGVTGAYTLGVQ